jgi:hypothetical protein
VRAFSVNRISGCKQLVAQIARQTTSQLNRLLAGATQDIQSNPRQSQGHAEGAVMWGMHLS